MFILICFISFLLSHQSDNKFIVERLLHDWKSAWESENLELIRKFYSLDYEYFGADGSKVNLDERLRKLDNTFRNYENINISIDNITINSDSISPSKIIVTFNQKYTSDKFSDYGIKTLLLRKKYEPSDEFEIYKESFKAIKDRDFDSLNKSVINEQYSGTIILMISMALIMSVLIIIIFIIKSKSGFDFRNLWSGTHSDQTQCETANGEGNDKKFKTMKKYTGDELQAIVETNYLYFLNLARKFKKEDINYYNEIVHPVLTENNLESINDTIEVSSRNKVQENGERKSFGGLKFIIFVGFLFIALILLYRFLLNSPESYSKFYGEWVPSDKQDGIYESFVGRLAIDKITITEDYVRIENFMGNGPKVEYNKRKGKIIIGENWFEFDESGKLYWRIRDHSTNFDLLLKKR